MAIILILQGDQKSPGIIPLAVKDVFSIIQEVILGPISLTVFLASMIIIILVSLWMRLFKVYL